MPRGFLNLHEAPNGQSWRQYVSVETPSAVNNSLAGRWGECLVAAVVAEHRRGFVNAAGDVLEYMYNSGGQQFEAAADNLEQASHRAIRMRLPLPRVAPGGHVSTERTAMPHHLESDSRTPISETCPRGHTLQHVQSARSTGAVCDRCHREFRDPRQILGCRICDWDVCRSCLSTAQPQPQKAQMAPAPQQRASLPTSEQPAPGHRRVKETIRRCPECNGVGSTGLLGYSGLGLWNYTCAYCEGTGKQHTFEEISSGPPLVAAPANTNMSPSAPLAPSAPLTDGSVAQAQPTTDQVIPLANQALLAPAPNESSVEPAPEPAPVVEPPAAAPSSQVAESRRAFLDKIENGGKDCHPYQKQ